MTAPPEPLLDLVRGAGRHLWVGNLPPFDFDSLALFGCTNFRAAAGLHQKFDVVWCYEQPVTALPAESHFLLLDELVRFIGAKGLLVLRYDLGHGVLNVKTTLGRRPGLTVRVLYEQMGKDDMVTTVFELERTGLDRYRPAPWTFGILTQNTRKPNVVAFLKSIRDRDPDRRHEVIICGPEAPEYAFAAPRYLPDVYSKERAEICRKKNDIAAAATHPNLLVCHDRYKLDDNFFLGFDQYGYDFDFLTVAQFFEDGSDFPGYCHLLSHDLRMAPPRMVKELNQLPGMPFLNGGLFAVKTHVLRAVPLNELVFWNQAEDVEWSTTLCRHGLPPRLNPYSSATTLGITRAYIWAFEPPAPPPPPPPEPEPPPVAVVASPPPPRRPLWRRALGKAKRLVLRRLKLLVAGVLLLMLLMQAAVLVAVLVRTAP